MGFRFLMTSALIATLLASLGVDAQVSGHRSSTRVYIGILDDERIEMANWEPGVAPDRVVRPAFEKTRNGWEPVNPRSFPSQMSWTVAFDGRSIGRIESRTVPADKLSGSRRYLSPVQQISTPRSLVPTIGSPEVKWGPMGDGPTKGRRPLVLVSQPNATDPDQWHRSTQPPTEILNAVRIAFRSDFPQVPRCKDETVLQRNWHFPDSALSAISTYASNKGSFLVEVNLTAGNCGYVDDPNDPLANPWFFVSAHQNPRRIGAFMSLLDAGDYDHDGRSEVIFMIAQPEDTEGFALFDSQMHRKASLLWAYH